MTDKRVAIIGGGLGGLVSAMFLEGRQSRDGASTYRCDLFESTSRVGGNMWSAYFDRAYEAPFADLAVNDFNANTYTLLLRLMDTLEAAKLPVPTGPLIDEASFFTARGAPGRAVAYTTDQMDSFWWRLVKPYLRGLAKDWKRFQGLAAEVMTDKAYATMSVSEFVKTQGLSQEFADLMLLPRINAMYFMTEGDPGAMPIRGVMYYYHLQEGLGSDSPTPDRRYFAKGASQWALQLETFVRRLGTRIHLNAPATVTTEGGVPSVRWPEQGGVRTETFDHVVCAVPPHLVGSVVEGLPRDFLDQLAAFGCYPATACVHSDEQVLPAHRWDWRTYNVLIQSAPFPYRMSYVNAMHNGENRKAPPFVSENVQVEDGKILDMVDLGGAGRVKAKAAFTHNTVSAQTMTFQADGLRKYQGRNHVWFTGGWTNGAGLQEQIIAKSIEVTARIRGFYLDHLEQGYRADEPDYVPHYLRRSLGIGKGAEDDFPPGFWPSP